MIVKCRGQDRPGRRPLPRATQAAPERCRVFARSALLTRPVLTRTFPRLTRPPSLSPGRCYSGSVRTARGTGAVSGRLSPDRCYSPPTPASPPRRRPGRCGAPAFARSVLLTGDPGRITPPPKVQPDFRPIGATRRVPAPFDCTGCAGFYPGIRTLGGSSSAVICHLARFF